MPRNRAVAILVRDEQLLVIYREHDSQRHYVFPGGGIEGDETNEQAIVREIDEEASIVITAGKLLYELRYDNGDRHFFFQCTYVSGEPQLRESSNEYIDTLNGDVHMPVWVDTSSLANITLYPTEIRDLLIRDLLVGFSNGTITVNAIRN